MSKLQTDPTRAAYEAALRGRFPERLDELLAPLDAKDAAAWKVLFELVGFGLGRRASLPAPPDHAGPVTVRVCERLQRLAVLEWRPDDADAARQQLNACATGDEDIVRALGRVRALVMAGERGASSHAKTVAAAAADARESELVVEASVLRALAHLGEGDIPEGLRLARRAARMARSEGVIEGEYFAYLVLARARRMSGQGAVASRILRMLCLVCPRPWRRWVGWELEMLGETAEVPGVSELLDAAKRGDRRRFDRTLDTLRARCAWSAPFRDDLRAVVTAVDPACQNPEEGALRAWITGTRTMPPPSLVALASRLTGGGVVIYRDTLSGRRFLRQACGLLERAGVERNADGGERAAQLLAVLALASPRGLPADDVFSAVFGIRRLEKHDGLFRTTLYRARALLGDAGDIVRAGTHLSLELNRKMVFVDPRWAGSVSEHLLFRLAARSGRATAKELADDVNAPLRTVQDLLKDLVEDDACARMKKGRQVVYVLEDTTCREPTLGRLTSFPGASSEGT